MGKEIWGRIGIPSIIIAALILICASKPSCLVPLGLLISTTALLLFFIVVDDIAESSSDEITGQDLDRL